MAPQPLPRPASPAAAEENPLRFQADVYPWNQPANEAGLSGHLLMPYLFSGINLRGHLPVDAGLSMDEPIRWLGFDRDGGLCVPIRLVAAIGTDLLTSLVIRQQARVANLWRIERERYHAAMQELMGEETFLTDLQTRSTNALHWADQLFNRGDDGLGTIRAGECYLELATRPRRRRVPLAPYTLPDRILRMRASRERALLETTILRVASSPTSQAVSEVMEHAVTQGTQGLLD